MKLTPRANSLSDLLDLFRKVEFTLLAFLTPALLSLAAAAFEGISVILLVPAVSASVKLDFNTVGRFRLSGVQFSQIPGLRSQTGGVLFVILLALICTFTLMKTLLSYCSARDCAFTTRRFSGRMRQKLFERCLTFGKLFFDMANAGQIQDVVLGSTGIIAAKLIVFQEMLTWLFMLMVYLVIMTWISWKLTLGLAIVFPLMHYTSRSFVAKMKIASTASSISRKNLSGDFANTLSCMLLIQSHANHDEESKRFAAANETLEALEADVDVKLGSVRFSQELIFLATLMGVLFALAFIAGRQRSGLAAELLVYVYLLRRSSTAMGTLGRFNATVAEIQGPMEQVLDLLKDEDKFAVPDGNRTFTHLNDQIELRNLHFIFPNGIRVLESLSFTVKAGTMVAIVGPSGTGKTTLINLMMRFYDPPPNTILLDGVDIRELTLNSFRPRVALVSQNPLLFNDTIRKNLSYPLVDNEISEETLWAALKQAKLDEFVIKLPKGLDTLIGDRGVKLSGGEKQRLAIGRAMLTKAEILILDEATSSLDSETELLIQESLATLVRGKTAIVIAHRLSTIQHADRIMVIEEGRMVEEGSWNELLERKGRFHHYWEAQKFQ